MLDKIMMVVVTGLLLIAALVAILLVRELAIYVYRSIS